MQNCNWIPCPWIFRVKLVVFEVSKSEVKNKIYERGRKFNAIGVQLREVEVNLYGNAPASAATVG